MAEERKPLTGEQLKALDALIDEVARRKFQEGDDAERPIGDWMEVAEDFAHGAMAAAEAGGYIHQAAEYVAEHPEIVAAMATALAFRPDYIDELPQELVAKLEEAGPLPSLEELILIRSRLR
jgi:hypothetical protein